jgi:branched-chain amino acid transport system ATP-binding protein
MKDAALITVRSLCVSFGGLVALSDVDFEVHAGDFVGICGPNKAGKSTICSALAGLLTPTSGSVVFEGRDITLLPVFERRQRGLLCCPEGRGVYPNLSVVDNLVVGLQRGGDGALTPGDRLARIFERFPLLASRQQQLAGTLSGGEAQILAIARRLIHGPKLLVVDEPFLGLAPKAIDAVMSSLSEIRTEGTAVLLIDEVFARLRAVAGHVYVLAQGRIVGAGNPHAAAVQRAAQTANAGQVERLTPTAEGPA